MSKFTNKDTLEFHKEMEELGMRGLSLKECGEYHGVDEESWDEWCKEHKLTEVSLQRGKSRGLALAGKQLIEQIKQGKIQAIMFYLKTQGNFTEKTISQIEESLKVAHLPIPAIPSDPVEASKTYQAFIKDS